MTTPKLDTKPKEQPRYLALVILFIFFYTAALSISASIRAHTPNTVVDAGYALPFIGWLIGILACEKAVRVRLPNRDPWIFPIIASLAGWGILTIWRLSPSLGLKQLAWFLVGSILVILGLGVRDLVPLLKRYKYIWLVLGLLLIALTFFVGVNPAGAGPKLWLHIFGIYVQPSEPLKLLMIIYLAAFFADQIRPNIPLLNAILPTLLLTGLAGLLLVGQRDLGTAALFVCIYGLMLTITTHRRRFLWLIPLAALVAGLVGYFVYDVIRVRVDIWLNPWLNPSGAGYQLIQAKIAVAAGGLTGTGPGLGSPQSVPVAVSDFIFTAIAEETGLLGIAAFMLLILLLTMRSLNIAQSAKTSFGRYLAFGLSTYIALQTFFIIGGNLGLFPLTGVTLPFVSYGGSSLVTNLLAAMLLMRVSTEKATNPLPLKSRQPYHSVAAGFLAIFMVIMLASANFAFFQQEKLLNRAENPRWAVYDRYSPRGEIVSQSGEPLVTTIGSPGSYSRQTTYPPLSNTLGYAIGLYGQTGIEQSLYSVLRGYAGVDYNDLWWHELLYNQPPAGLDVKLNLSQSLQAKADQLLGDEKGAVVLLNAHTGEIYALASHPNFDANTLEDDWETMMQSEDAPLLNRTVQAEYPIGTLAAIPALSAFWSGQQDIYIPPEVSSKLDTACYQAMLGEEYNLNPLKFGCEAGTKSVLDNVDAASLVDSFYNFGLFSAPQVVMEVGTPAEMPTTEAYMSFFNTAEQTGVSPLQMALVAAAISNDGITPAPKLVNSYKSPTGEWIAYDHASTEQQAIPVQMSQALRDLFRSSSYALWYQSGHAQLENDGILTWYMGGTTSDWHGTPLAIAVAIENNNPALAQQIGTQLLTGVGNR